MTEPLELDLGAEWVGDEEEFAQYSDEALEEQLRYVLDDLERCESYRPEWEPGVEWARCLRNQRYWLLSEIERRKA